MSLRRSPLVWLAPVVLAVTIAWFWITPRRAWDRLLTAVEFTDADALARAVDFPRLEAHLRTDLTRAVQARNDLSAALATNPTQQASLAASFAAAGASPEGLRSILHAFHPGDATPSTAFRYRSPLRVDVVLTGANGGTSDTGIFTFTLTGGTWRLVRIQSGWLTAQ